MRFKSLYGTEIETELCKDVVIVLVPAQNGYLELSPDTARKLGEELIRLADAKGEGE